MNIVCVGAHQDDIDINCLGTLLKYQAKGGVTITNVSVSNGDKGAQYDLSMPYAEVTAMRNAEAAAIVETLGGRFICMGQPDEYVQDTEEARNQMTDILREAKADIVFTSPPNDYNTDHIVAGQIAYHACLLVSVRTIYTEHDPLPDFPAMYYMDTSAGLDWQPTHYVDISDVFERKCELLQLYKSQMRNMKQFGGWDLVTYARIVGAFRGLQCGVQYAEAFKPALAWPRVRAGNLLP
jgi:N-acetylglucosamine malate deacetylase 1